MSKVGFDENPDFQARLSANICVALGADIERLEAPSVVYNLIKESAWDLWKRLRKEAIFESPKRGR